MKNGIHYNPETLQTYEIFRLWSGDYLITTTTDFDDFTTISVLMSKRRLIRDYKELNLKYLGEF